MIRFKNIMLWAGLQLMALYGFSQTPLHRLNMKSPQQLQAFFKHSENNAPVISGHRGCDMAGYPENSIEAFEYVLRHTPAFFEIDPRMTKDSVIVLMHDATLDRTTNGTGKLSDYTWAEVQQLQLKDRFGKLTPYRVPTLAQVIEWGRGKTILNLDRKDVPPEITDRIIKEHKAGSFVMVTVHNAEQARFYFNRDPNRMMSAFVKTEKALQEYEAAGIPWKNMIAYIGSENKPENKIMLDLLHQRKVKCMISAAPVYDKLITIEERAEAYRDIFRSGADILESDLPVEVARAIRIPLKKK
jgi:glycerophosphoryl diester phosphodiesterase